MPKNMYIYKTLYLLGITPTYRCFLYTAYIVNYLVENKSKGPLNLAKLARDLDTTPKRLERNLHFAAVTAWEENSHLLTQLAMKPLSAAPSAPEFLYLLAAHFIRQQKAS